VSVGTNRVLGVGPAALEALRDAVTGEIAPGRAATPDGWDGRASERVADALAARYGDATGDATPTPAARAGCNSPSA
jgi:hypothetical protein